MNGAQRIAVIGGGISGLAAAHRLVARGRGEDVLLLEATDRLGGKLLTEHVDGFTIEGGPDAFLANKPRGVGLSEELGLASQFVTPDERQRGSFILRKGKLYPLPEGLSGLVPTKLRPMAATRLISPLGKARMALDFVLPPRTGDDDESLGSFLTRRLGDEAVANLIEPLMAGIYAGDASRLSLAATFPQLRTAERDHGGLIKGVIAARRAAERNPRPSGRTGFVSFAQGIGTLTDSLASRIRAAGATIETSTSVTAIAPIASGYRLAVERRGVTALVDVAGIVLATPAWSAAPLLSGLDADAGRALGEIPHVSTALVALAFDASASPRADALHGFGYVVPRQEHRDVMAMTWLSSKWAGRAPAGKILLRGFAGRSGQEHVYAKSDDALVQAVREEVRTVSGISGMPLLQRVYRWDRGMPQYNLGHLDRVHRIETGVGRLANFAVAGNYLQGVGIPDCIRSGEDAADTILARFSAPAPRPVRSDRR